MKSLSRMSFKGKYVTENQLTWDMGTQRPFVNVSMVTRLDLEAGRPFPRIFVNNFISVLCLVTILVLGHNLLGPMHHAVLGRTF